MGGGGGGRQVFKDILALWTAANQPSLWGAVFKRSEQSLWVLLKIWLKEFFSHFVGEKVSMFHGIILAAYEYPMLHVTSSSSTPPA